MSARPTLDSGPPRRPRLRALSELSGCLSRMLLVVLTFPFATTEAADPPAVDRLQQQLRAGDGAARMAAARSLGELGPAATAAIDDLIRALQSTDLGLRYESAHSLGRIGPPAARAVPALLALLQDDAPLLRYAGMDSLRHMGAASADVRTALVDRLTHDDLPGNRVTAARALAELAASDNAPLPDAVLPALLNGLMDQQAHVVAEAAHGLASLGRPAADGLAGLLRGESEAQQIRACEALTLLGLSGASAAQPLLELLDSDSPALQQQAIRAVAAVGVEAGLAVPALQQRLGSSDVQTQLAALSALGEYGADAASCVDDIAALLSSPDAQLQRAAAETLGAIGPAASRAIPQLLKALRDDQGSVTIEAAHALSQMGPHSVEPLIRLLDDDTYRELAAAILGDLGAVAAPATARLTELLVHSDLEVRRAALLALAGIGPPARAAVPQLLELLQSDVPLRQAGAAYALARLGAEEAVPMIAALVSQTQDPQVGLAATWALITLQPSAPGIEQAVPLLTAGLADEWDLVRRECATALGMLGARAVSAEAALLPLLEDPVPEVRAETLVTLHDIGSDVSRLLPRLTAGLHDPAPAVRYASAYVLGRVGPSAQSAIPQLREMLNRRNELDRTFAAWALVKISPTPRNRREATPLMVSALTHPRAAIRREAATLLGELGPRGAAARRALTRATQDDDPSVRAAAAEALEKLPPPQNPDSQTR